MIFLLIFIPFIHSITYPKVKDLTKEYKEEDLYLFDVELTE